MMCWWWGRLGLCCWIPDGCIQGEQITFSVVFTSPPLFHVSSASSQISCPSGMLEAIVIPSLPQSNLALNGLMGGGSLRFCKAKCCIIHDLKFKQTVQPLMFSSEDRRSLLHVPLWSTDNVVSASMVNAAPMPPTLCRHLFNCPKSHYSINDHQESFSVKVSLRFIVKKIKAKERSAGAWCASSKIAD